MAYLVRHDVLSWGRIVRTPQRVAAPRFRDELAQLVQARPGTSVLAVGLRRSYGDTVLNTDGGLIVMTGLDRVIAFDPQRGRLRAEVGLSLADIMRLVVPHGLFVPVTPGTRFVTLGGAIANDVHGKNHHGAGTFGRHVARIGLLRSDGGRVEIGPDTGADLFAATVGGLGLTGIIEWAEIDLAPIKSSFLDVEIVPFGNLTEFWQLAAASAVTHEHTVAWIDCAATNGRFGRGIFSRGNWSRDGGLTLHDDRQWLGVPLEAPSWPLNSLSVTLFNRLYYAAQKRKSGRRRLHYGPFFHPLDAVANWNRLYGRAGFWQYQCVLPLSTMRDGIAALMTEITRSGQGSFLAVLKTFGSLTSPGFLSFPMEGATLALDFPNRGERTLRLFTRLDAIVREGRGRLYAAKDGRIPRDMWARGYAALDRYVPQIDPAFASDFWKRVTA